MEEGVLGYDKGLLDSVQNLEHFPLFYHQKEREHYQRRERHHGRDLFLFYVSRKLSDYF